MRSYLRFLAGAGLCRPNLDHGAASTRFSPSRMFLGRNAVRFWPRSRVASPALPRPSRQALLIYNLGTSEVTAGELRSRGRDQGSNVSYNLKKLVELGYVGEEMAVQGGESTANAVSFVRSESPCLADK
ncbi:winged helix DNA-binding protein, partial [Paracoccus sp. APAP_BH8]|uniref:winged helix DNA-binding protein n=1 Tax=Paracoccus sp. APAP_BH8 TaxID=3110237 RepID=UPI002FD81929